MENTKEPIYNQLANLIYVEGLKPSFAATLLCVAFSACNQPLGIPMIVSKYFSTLDSIDEKVKWIEYTRNAIIKSSVISGIARGINGQVELYQSIPKEYQTLLRKTPTIDENNNHGNTRGVELIRKVYGTESEWVELELNATNPDLYCWTKQVYGNVLAETTYLNCLETELVLIVTLIQMNTLRQLRYHLDNAKQLGAIDQQIQSVESIGIGVRNAFL
ncbi:hypothetical protein EDC94DRAFT_254861 [Helicostylum pulchrum]|uniref:Carboxymuconolactone decarboxylase-like domain-containing protein n=1 Tax=Helicostylum pulchrum TaxID=562976 RepID=A0ABP9XLL3_9FUNG|nr:hypothetical protein EDC94DRAFT_254861 [Helicostylum pulchrum]